MPHCNHCDNYVSNRFVSVFADEDGRVRACPDCAAKAGIAETSRRRATRT